LNKLTTKGGISQGLFKNNRFYFDLCVNVSIWELNKYSFSSFWEESNGISYIAFEK